MGHDKARTEFERRRELLRMEREGKVLLAPAKPLIDETHNGGPSNPISMQSPGGQEIHVGLTVLDQYALVALKAWIDKGAGVTENADGKGVTVDTKGLASLAFETARDCLQQRNMIRVSQKPPEGGELEGDDAEGPAAPADPTPDMPDIS